VLGVNRRFWDSKPMLLGIARSDCSAVSFGQPLRAPPHVQATRASKKSAAKTGGVNFALTKLHQHCLQMRRNRSSAGPAVAEKAVRRHARAAFFC
jgi:hypothetical protein